MTDINRHDAEQAVRQINQHHFDANPSPTDEEWLAYHRDERDNLINKLNNAGYAVTLQRGDSLEHCGRYMLGERKYPILEDNGICSVCPACGKLCQYKTMHSDDKDTEKLIDALHKHLDFCKCRGRI